MAIDKLTEFSRTGDKNTEDLNLEVGFPIRLQPARQWMNWLFNSLTKKVNELIDASNSLLSESDENIGLISICPFEAIPTNYLECNGQTYNKSDYPNLAEKLGNLYGGDANTFMVPDYRAEFIRGWDHGRDIDFGRTLGSKQDDAIRNIEGSMKAGSTDDGNIQFIDGLNTNGAFEVIPGNKNSTGDTGGSGNAWGVKFDASLVVPTADENRPRNISAIYVIKAK
ncbi:phage tail protein [Acinetobacter bereziniae]|uniref:phage tail protein n=1 Tax=Acinetobacter bereziniae TaxID=106648 RepID=UPI0030083303